jgi:hypothetical protein
MREQNIRLWRVGIMNESAEIIRKVRVVIESVAFIKDGEPIPPSPDQPALLEHALNVMGVDKKTGMVNLSPGDTPTAYIDVVQQLTIPGKEPDRWMSLCYATGHRTPMTASGKWIVGLRAEGGGTYCRARFAIESNERNEIVLKPYGLP